MTGLITEIETRVKRLAPRSPDTFYTDVTDLSTSVGRLRRVARIAKEVAEQNVTNGGVTIQNVTNHRVTIGGGFVTVDNVRLPITETRHIGAPAANGVAADDRDDEDHIESSPEDLVDVALSGDGLAGSGDSEAAAVRAGGEATFASLVEPYWRELQVHCYRLVGSYDDADDLVQDSFLKAWQLREGFAGRSTFRAWLYRIATAVCVEFLRDNARKPGQHAPIPSVDSGDGAPPAKLAWLQPYPGHLLADLAHASDQRATIELAFVAAVQHLPPRQRAVLLLRDVLGWTAADTAAQLDMSVASANSALQRARDTLRRHLPERGDDWSAPVGATSEEREILDRYMAARDALAPDAVADLIAEDVVVTMPPNPYWFVSRDALLEFVRPSVDPASPTYLGDWRHLPASANGQPAAAGYLRRPGTTVFRAQVLDVLRVEDGRIVEITSFEPHLFAAFGLPLTL